MSRIFTLAFSAGVVFGFAALATTATEDSNVASVPSSAQTKHLEASSHHEGKNKHHKMKKSHKNKHHHNKHHDGGDNHHQDEGNGEKSTSHEGSAKDLDAARD